MPNVKHTETMSSEQQYTDLYAQNAGMIARHCAPLLNAPREAAAEAFAKGGFPTRRDEKYKYTDVAAAFAPDYGVNLDRIPVPVNPYEAYRCPVHGLGDASYYVLNDTFCPPPADAPRHLPPGVIVASLAEVAASHPTLVEPYYGRLAEVSDAVTAINTMLAQDGLFVYIPAGVKVEHPIQIVNVAHANVDFMNNRRVLIVVGQEAEATILFCDHATEERRFLNTQVVEIHAAERSVLNMYCLEETHADYHLFNNMYARQAEGSRIVFNNLMLHNGLTRNMLYVKLDGNHAETECYGCIVADKDQHVDNHVIVDHASPECTSNILYKYLLDGRAVGGFVGHVLVRKDAQHTYSEETNANICVSKDARIYTRPMLEIYADDVKCNHGATTGRMDESALFYMRQRGIPEAEARILLQHAFINDVISRINVESLRTRLSDLVEARFRGEPGTCAEHKCRMV